MRERCQAVVHSEKCNGYADNLDHFQPKCVAKIWRKSTGEISNNLARKAAVMKDPNELLPMNVHCHRLKDSSTPERYLLLARILTSDKPVTLDEYRQWRNENDLVFTEDEYSSGFVILTETDKPVSELSPEEWNEFVRNFSDDIQREYPELWKSLFGEFVHEPRNEGQQY